MKIHDRTIWGDNLLPSMSISSLSFFPRISDASTESETATATTPPSPNRMWQVFEATTTNSIPVLIHDHEHIGLYGLVIKRKNSIIYEYEGPCDCQNNHVRTTNVLLDTKEFSSAPEMRPGSSYTYEIIDRCCGRTWSSTLLHTSKFQAYHQN